MKQCLEDKDWCVELWAQLPPIEDCNHTPLITEWGQYQYRAAQRNQLLQEMDANREPQHQGPQPAALQPDINIQVLRKLEIKREDETEHESSGKLTRWLTSTWSR